MGGRTFSLILLPTLGCNAACDYCFESRTGERLSLDELDLSIGRVFDHLVARGIPELLIHWQGGEVMTLTPAWFEEADERIGAAAAARGRSVRHGLQTNLIGYGAHWNPVIARMFGNQLSTSLDHPNLYRHRPGRSPADYDALWTQNLKLARAAGIEVGVIAVPNAATLELGAERFYEHFVDVLGITSFQVNTPFPGGVSNAAKRDLPVGGEGLMRFYLDLAEVWLARGQGRGVTVGPFDALLDWFSGEPAQLPCIWTDNCTHHMLALGPGGHLAQCDCWIASYPDYRFGNLLTPAAPGLGVTLSASPVRERFLQRPMALAGGDCIDCPYLALCHGGCPVRAFSLHGTLFEKDPHCALYRALFERMASAAAGLAAERAGERVRGDC